MTHRERVDALVRAFVDASEEAQRWQRHPAPEPGAELRLARELALFAEGRGMRARIIHASGGEHPGHEETSWVRVLNVEGIHGYDVDPAATRFGDPELPCPLVWAMDGAHPVTGRHRTLRGVPATAEDPE